MTNTIGVRPVGVGVEVTVWNQHTGHSVIMKPTEAIGFADSIIREALLILERGDGSPTPPRPDYRSIRAA